MSNGWATAINWVSSAFIPAGTLITNLWWSNKAPQKVDELLRIEPAYIHNISVSFSNLEKLEKLGYGKQFKVFMDNCQSIAPNSINKIKAEVIETIKQTAEKSQKDWIEAEQTLNNHKKNFSELDNYSKLLFEIIDEWGPALIKILEDLKNKKQEFIKNELDIDQEAEKIGENFILIRSDESKLQSEMENISEKLKDKQKEIEIEKNVKEIQKIKQEILILKYRLPLLDKIKAQFREKRNIKVLEEQVRKTLQLKNIEINEKEDLEKVQQTWLIAMQKAKDKKNVIDRKINVITQQILKFKEVSIKFLAINQRTSRVLEAIKKQFPEKTPQQIHEDVKKIIDDTFAPSIVREDPAKTVTFSQIFHEFLTPLGNFNEDITSPRDEKGDPIPIVIAFDRKRSSNYQIDEVSIPILTSSSPNRSKAPQLFEKSLG